MVPMGEVGQRRDRPSDYFAYPRFRAHSSLT